VDQLRSLVVDDAADYRELLASLLEGEGFAVETAADGPAAIEAAETFAPDVILLDLGLPGADGVEVCRRLRTLTDAYVVVVSGRLEEDVKLAALSAGADDYVTKPFSPLELVARVRAMLRRPRAAAGAARSGSVRRVGRIVVDLAAREVRVDDRAIELTRIEFELIDALSERPRVALTRPQLLERVWGPNWFGDEHVVDVHISKLRHKLGDAGRSPQLLRTVRGVGYRLDGGTDPP
jgi:DNA-binding response OmpR family regulator